MEEEKSMNQIIGLIEEFGKLQQVSAIALGGSRGTHTEDKDSDYDLYMYVTEEIDLSDRKRILEKYCNYLELGNDFWELEDDCRLNSGTIIEIIYRRIEDLDEQLEVQLYDGQAGCGYTTCMWYNLLNSIILYDKYNTLKMLVEKYSLPYPEQLRKNIIQKNLRLLDNNIPSFNYQIEKAAKRGDMVSINHRIAAFLASYFDIIWAINKKAHPGEKRLITLCKEKCSKLPTDFEVNLNVLLSAGNNTDIIMKQVHSLNTNLIKLLVQEKLV